ncbi:branched-chain amino acid ABC transporter permease [Polycladidibacter stylochi]|uniref:branched-chain amino acid ABC transporter permease n=1 Tax=Polycladidibacter stylochi TaxID=1807766 RepID=UPI0009E96682|nr:branched-chain amino acid ABC transporter permease [Pseudovibrio stylochi]
MFNQKKLSLAWGNPPSRDRNQNLAYTLRITVGLVWAILLLAPFLFHDVRALEVAARICIFIVLVASYDLLIGITGIVSFAHTLFFACGAYGAAIGLKLYGGSWSAYSLGSLAGMLLAVTIAAVIGLLSLRVKAIFFAMITLAVASLALVMVSQFSAYTGGEDGLTYKTPALFKTATKLLENENGSTVKVFGTKLNGKLAAYYFLSFSCLLIFALTVRLVATPLGSVLKAIRENDTRAEAIGYRVVRYRSLIFCLSAASAAVAGSIYAVWLKYTGPETVLSFTIMIDILLMVVIGGMGTIWGSVPGVLLLVLAQYYLRDLMEIAAEKTTGIPLLPELLSPERWLLWLGIGFILVVYFFPKGLAGAMLASGEKR